ncbi:LPS assembly lipoprotein LptE [Hyphomonas sp.]|uniref:LPS assembly lipoprotein LptE n=1 Tax=Hyphomonas sp. TaxID=87 RepID=UPI003528F63D
MKRFLIALALILPACGFQPVYAPGGSASFASGNITVKEIPGRSGYILRRALQQELAAGLPNLGTTAILEVKLSDNLTRLQFKPDGAASRSSYTAKATYALSGESVSVVGSSDAETSFSVPDQPYGDISAQTNATDRIMRVLAGRIVDDLRLQLAAKN